MPQPTLLSFSPSPITLTGVKSTTVFAVTDANAEYPGGPGSYLGFYRATSEDTSIATVAPGPIEGEFKVTSVAGGSTSIDVSSTDGGFGQLPVTVNDSGTIIDLKGGPR